MKVGILSWVLYLWAYFIDRNAGSRKFRNVHKFTQFTGPKIWEDLKRLLTNGTECSVYFGAKSFWNPYIVVEIPDEFFSFSLTYMHGLQFLCIKKTNFEFHSPLNFLKSFYLWFTFRACLGNPFVCLKSAASFSPLSTHSTSVSVYHGPNLLFLVHFRIHCPHRLSALWQQHFCSVWNLMPDPHKMLSK